MQLKSILLWLGVGVLVSGLYLGAAYFHLLGTLRSFAEGAQLQVFVSGSCPHSQPLVASPPEETVVLPVDWDDATMTMTLCGRFMGEGVFSAVPLRMRCEWVVQWAEDETREAVGFPAYRQGAGPFDL